jgi:hypothetical protein
MKKQEARNQVKRAYGVEEENSSDSETEKEDNEEGLGEKLVTAASIALGAASMNNMESDERRTIEVEPGVTVSLGADNVIQQAMFQVLGKLQLGPMGAKGNMHIAQARVAEIAQAFAKVKIL